MASSPRDIKLAWGLSLVTGVATAAIISTCPSGTGARPEEADAPVQGEILGFDEGDGENIDNMQETYAKVIMDTLNINVDGSKPVDSYEIRPGDRDDIRDIYFPLSDSVDPSHIGDLESRIQQTVDTLNFGAIQLGRPCIVAPFPIEIDSKPIAHVQMACF
ncbi:hypothetical protein HY463_01055 [Candidatus Peregrinibacteria bacterium]|nr:hypothetical protein [Candidatus Peregrinibacteria bacterium]